MEECWCVTSELHPGLQVNHLLHHCLLYLLAFVQQLIIATCSSKLC